MKVAIGELGNLRQWDNKIPFDDRKVTLICVDVNRNIQSTKTLGGKAALLKNADKDDIFLVAWTGSYSTDIFTANIEQIKEVTKEWYCWSRDTIPKQKKKPVSKI